MSALDPRGWAASVRRPEHRRALQLVVVAVAALATLLLYVAATRPSTRRVSLVIEQQPAAPSAIAPATTAASAATATIAPSTAIPATPATTASPAAVSSAATVRPSFPPSSAIAPAGATIATRVELTGADGSPVAVALAGTAARDAGCAAGFLQLSTHGEGGWLVTFDGGALPADAPLLGGADGSCPSAPTLVALGGFIAAGEQYPDGSARVVVFDTSGAMRLDLRSAGTGTLAVGPTGATVELDEPATATVNGAQLTIGTFARIVGVVDGSPAVLRARIVPACDRGRLQPGSAAATVAAVNGSAGTVTIACSSGVLMSAEVAQNTLLDILAAQASAIHDRDYVELSYDDASLSVDPGLGGDLRLPRLALLTDNTAALRAYDPPAAATRAPTSVRAPAASSGASRPAPQPTAPRSAPAGSGSTRSSGGAPAPMRSNSAPAQHAQPAPTRPAATRPALQPPAPPGSAAGGAPP